MHSKLMAQLVRHEGIELKPYRCSAGALTIGVGHNLDDLGLTRHQAMSLLEDDIKRIRREMGAYYQWFYALDPVRRDALTNMAFNLGLTRFRGFLRMVAAIEQKNYDKAAFEMMDSKWARQVGTRATELAEMMRTGSYGS